MKICHLIGYSLVALVFFFLGLLVSPGSIPRRKIVKKLSYTKAAAQRKYDKWDKASLVFFDSGQSLADFESQHDTFILYFWATWCPHCRNIQDKMNLIDEDLNSYLPLVSLSFDTKKEDFDLYSKEYPYTFPVLVERKSYGENSFCLREGNFNIPSIPSAWVIKSGKIQKIFIGEKGADKLYEWLREQKF